MITNCIFKDLNGNGCDNYITDKHGRCSDHICSRSDCERVICDAYEKKTIVSNKHSFELLNQWECAYHFAESNGGEIKGNKFVAQL
jgi:hypothetical protein